jgi:HK97 family phage major capsid protein
VPYNDVIDRTGAAAMIPEQAAREIFAEAAEESAFMNLARRLPDMARGQVRIPVLSALPIAYFVTGDTGLKQTTDMAWENVYINAEEIAVIVPIPEAVLADADYDIWAEVRPRVAEAIGYTVDRAIFHGTNKPASWPTGIVAASLAAANQVDSSVHTGDIYDEIFGPTGVIALLEADGYMSTGFVGAMSLRGALRGLRETATGQPIFTTSLQARGQYALDGETIVFPTNGGIDPTAVTLIAGDWTRAVYAVRQDVTFKLLTEAVIQDNLGAIVYNLAQQDMVALRATFRMGWAVPNPINRLQPTAASRYPFATLVP